MSANAPHLGERRNVFARVSLLQVTVVVVLLALGVLIMYGPASWLV